MKGRIYTAQKCYRCGGSLKYIEGRGVMQCPEHPEVAWEGACVVRFGRNHTKRFKTVLEAERHLTYIRVQTDRGSFDHREWAKEQPLSFLVLRTKFLEHKLKQDISATQKRHIKMVLNLAGQEWDHLNIMNIAEAEIEDFFEKDHGVGGKTLNNYKHVLSDFWTWIVRREKRKSGLQMPVFPTISFQMELKTVVSMEDQQEIIEEVKRISYDFNPRIWLAIKILSLYPRIRPIELRNIKEGHINLQENWIIFPQPKERKPKYIHLLPEIADLFREVRDESPRGLPDMYFFRHLSPKNGLKPGTKFGPRYLNTWWKQACENLGVNGVTLYPGTKHSTVTALGKIMSPEQIQHNVTGHVSDAFKRYFLPDIHDKIVATTQVNEMQKKAGGKVIRIRKKKAG